jgi:hypothetical protein
MSMGLSGAALNDCELPNIYLVLGLTITRKNEVVSKWPGLGKAALSSR